MENRCSRGAPWARIRHGRLQFDGIDGAVGESADIANCKPLGEVVVESDATKPASADERGIALRQKRARARPKRRPAASPVAAHAGRHAEEDHRPHERDDLQSGEHRPRRIGIEAPDHDAGLLLIASIRFAAVLAWLDDALGGRHGLRSIAARIRRR